MRDFEWRETRGESEGRGNLDWPHRTFWLLVTPIIVPSIQFHASTQASSEMESGDTSTVYGVMDSVGTVYMYMTNMIQTSPRQNLGIFVFPARITFRPSQLLPGKRPLYMRDISANGVVFTV